MAQRDVSAPAVLQSRFELVSRGEGRRQCRGTPLLLQCGSEQSTEHRGGVGNAGGRMSTAGHSWSDPLINCLLLFYLLQSFYFCIICFPVQVKQRGTFWNLNSEVLELSSCWGKSWSSAPDGFWNGWQCFIVSRSLPKAGTILLCWATWLSLCYQTSQEWEQNRNACCYLKDP